MTSDELSAKRAEQIIATILLAGLEPNETMVREMAKKQATKDADTLKSNAGWRNGQSIAWCDGCQTLLWACEHGDGKS